jgi:hypothetical protein
MAKKESKNATRRSNDTSRGIKESRVAVNSKSQEDLELEQFKEDIKTSVIETLSPKLDEGFDRIFEKLSKQFVSREELEHEKLGSQNQEALPSLEAHSDTENKMPDLSGLASMVQNLVPNSSSSPLDNSPANPLDQQNPMQNMMGNPLVQMIMQQLFKPDTPVSNSVFNPATMNELALRMMMDNMTLQSTINKAFMQKIAGQGADVLSTHDHLMSPLTKLGEKSKLAEAEAKIKELKERVNKQ